VLSQQRELALNINISLHGCESVKSVTQNACLRCFVAEDGIFCAKNTDRRKVEAFTLNEDIECRCGMKKIAIFDQYIVLSRKRAI